MKSNKRALITGALAAALFFSGDIHALEEGGYAGTTDEGHDTVVYNFLKHFNYEQYYYSYKHQWSYNNNNRVDAMDFAVFGGHGGNWKIKSLDGWLDLTTAGEGSVKGWGNVDAEFVAFESCSVVPSPIEVTNWYSKWTNGTGDVFDGLHQAVGFHTSSWQSTDQKVTDYFGGRIKNGYKVWQSWFAAINAKGRDDEFGSAVMHPSAENDTYYSVVADPAENHTSLKLWYQY